MVTGGNGFINTNDQFGGNGDRLSNTEILIQGSESWTLLPSTSDLPTPRLGQTSVSLDNNIFIIG